MKRNKLIIFLTLILSLCMLLSACDFSTGKPSDKDNTTKTKKPDGEDKGDGKLINLESFLDVYKIAYDRYELTVNTYETEDYFEAIAFGNVGLAGATLANGPMYDMHNPNNKDGKYEGDILGTLRKIEKTGKDITFGYESIAEEDFFEVTKKGDIDVEKGVADLQKGYIIYEFSTKRDEDIIKKDYEEAYVISKDEIVIAGASGRSVRERETKDSMYFVRITKDVLEFVMIEGLFGVDYEYLPLDKNTTSEGIKEYCEENDLEISLSGTIKGDKVTIND